MMMFEFEESPIRNARMKVVGVGGAGGNAVECAGKGQQGFHDALVRLNLLGTLRRLHCRSMRPKFRHPAVDTK